MRVGLVQDEYGLKGVNVELDEEEMAKLRSEGEVSAHPGQVEVIVKAPLPVYVRKRK